jgi:hypothetical protein
VLHGGHEKHLLDVSSDLWALGTRHLKGAMNTERGLGRPRNGENFFG